MHDGDVEIGDVSTWETGELRERRRALQVDEEAVSYARRLLHGRIDLVTAELAQRQSVSDDDPLVDRLAGVLADRPSPPRAVTALRALRLRHPERAEDLERQIDALLPPTTRLAEATESWLRERAQQLLAAEEEMSRRRRALFRQIDALQAELAARYRDGRARASDLLDD
ncbi:MAG: hypothetical protein WD011_01980 [Nitriliruptoraceae bacterium]